MTFEALSARAERLAAAPYAAPPADLPPALAGLDYDGYRGIVFRPSESLRLGSHFSAQFFHRGFLQRKRVALYLQPRGGPARPIPYESRLFDLGRRLAGQAFSPDLGFAGLRLHYAFPDTPAWRPKGFQEEFLVFLGASYFRLRAANQEYGLSARGLAIGTGAPEGEEFPDFIAHWICEPEAGARTLTLLSLLDSPSVAGAYQFEIAPGDPARITVSAALYPRRSIARLGLAPLTSMFLYGQNGPGARGAKAFDDFRPQVHDSDGLCVAAGGGASADRIWRPLVNGRSQPQISAFAAKPLGGFGLLQRERSFAAYLDVEARQEARPGLWVAPDPQAGAAFAEGAVQLFEIPSGEEYMDNVVAAFVPAVPAPAGTALRLAYRLTTVGAEPVESIPEAALARVTSTRFGSAERLRPMDPPSPQRRLCVIDFEGQSLPKGVDDAVAAEVSASAGTLHEPVANFVPQTGGWRIYVEWRPPQPMPAGDVVLRARLVRGTVPISETWDAVV
ncbi:glucan biosynthesis protein [Methylobacterium sp. NEAU K]|uniref:glucan biosynthesis protein n=1 Tax=Methylobacterium sp. NEAU K TaxID=3064946 RepID=UPI0027333905|nr:glucan biosynthesis protein [Methylobacterium sp. NEAU K]MDP4004588.1 glucan biosynthesis protein [Methylobacterium sp. NEAU K]